MGITTNRYQDIGKRKRRQTLPHNFIMRLSVADTSAALEREHQAQDVAELSSSCEDHLPDACPLSLWLQFIYVTAHIYIYTHTLLRAQSRYYWSLRVSGSQRCMRSVTAQEQDQAQNGRSYPYSFISIRTRRVQSTHIYGVYVYVYVYICVWYM